MTPEDMVSFGSSRGHRWHIYVLKRRMSEVFKTRSLTVIWDSKNHSYTVIYILATVFYFSSVAQPRNMLECERLYSTAGHKGCAAFVILDWDLFLTGMCQSCTRGASFLLQKALVTPHIQRRQNLLRTPAAAVTGRSRRGLHQVHSCLR